MYTSPDHKGASRPSSISKRDHLMTHRASSSTSEFRFDLKPLNMDDRQDAADDISIDLSNPEEQQPPDLHLKSTPNNYEERVIETEFVESDTSMDDKPDSASQKKMVKEMELNEI